MILQAIKNVIYALADVAHYIAHRPVNQRVTSSTPNQGTCLYCGPGPQQGACRKQAHIDVSLPLFLSLFPSV